MGRRTQTKLKQLLEQSGTTAEFLQDVIGAIESLYAEEDGSECPEGFAALDSAVSAFEKAEDPTLSELGDELGTEED